MSATPASDPEQPIRSELFSVQCLEQHAESLAEALRPSIRGHARDLELTYQYSNFGVPGLGLKRGLSEHAVVAPYATALAAMVDAPAAAQSFLRLAAAGARGRFGYYEAQDYTRTRVPEDEPVAVVRACMAHHQGMTLVAIANTLQDGPCASASMRSRSSKQPSSYFRHELRATSPLPARGRRGTPGLLKAVRANRVRRGCRRSPGDALDLADKHHDSAAFDRAITLAWSQAQVQLHHPGIALEEAHLFQRLASHVLYSDPLLRPPSAVLKRTEQGQSTLWAYGISGDLPIVLVRIDEPEDVEIVRQLLRAHEYWRLKQLAVDLVILNERPPSYAQDLHASLQTLVRTSQSRPHPETEDTRGSVFVLRTELVSTEARTLLQSAARAVLLSRRGSLAEQVKRIEVASPYVVRHGQGYTRCEHASHGISLDLVQYVPLDDPIRISRLKIQNRSGRSRRLPITAYVEGVRGTSRGASAPFGVTEVDEKTGAMLARNHRSKDFGKRVAFADLGGQKPAWTGNRTEFLGRNGTLDQPAALVSLTPAGGAVLSNRVGAGLDPCGALQAQLELKPNGAAEIVFFLGEASTKADALGLIERYRAVDRDQVFAAVIRHWDNTLRTVQVKTPDRSMDILLNRWLLYQTLACRVWARSGFYQASGAYGFRDQLQDMMALTVSNPDLTRPSSARSGAAVRRSRRTALVDTALRSGQSHAYL